MRDCIFAEQYGNISQLFTLSTLRNTYTCGENKIKYVMTYGYQYLRILKMEKCLVDGCKRKVSTPKHGLCRGHYDRYLRLGDVGTEPLRESRNLIPYRLIKENQSKMA